MYLLATHIPIFVDGDQCYIDVSWHRDVLLARDWLAKGIGPLVLIAPSLPINMFDDNAIQIAPIGKNDGVRVVPSFDPRCRFREFWASNRRHWNADVTRELSQAKIIHCSASQIAQPIWYLALMHGIRANVTTVLVGPDMDPHLTLTNGLKNWICRQTFDFMMKNASRKADLVLLKEGEVHRRYGHVEGNVKAFCHSMYHDDDVLGTHRLEYRLDNLKAERRLKAVYSGRFVARKGLLDAIDAVAAARRRGVEVEYHLIGKGPEEEGIRQRVAIQGLEDLVKFHGYIEYGKDFIARLAEFDLILFTPTEEDTPRMLYDAMAAGLPLVGSRIPFLECRVKSDRFGILSGIGDIEQFGNILCKLDADRQQLADLSKAALAAGRRHSVEQWYSRRSDWTKQALNRHRSD